VWASSVHRPRKIAVMAGYNQAVVSVPGPSQPSVKAAAAILSNCSTVYTAVIVYMVQCEKLERTLTATHAPDLAVAVVRAARRVDPRETARPGARCCSFGTMIGDECRPLEGRNLSPPWRTCTAGTDTSRASQGLAAYRTRACACCAARAASRSGNTSVSRDSERDRQSPTRSEILHRSGRTSA